MKRQLRFSGKAILTSVIMLMIGFLAGYASVTWHAREPDSTFPDVPNNELWFDKEEVLPSEADHFASTLEHTDVVVIRSDIKYPHPDVYRVISKRERIDEIVQAMKIRYRRRRQPMQVHQCYQLFFLSARGDYVINYERIPKGGSVISMIPVAVEYDSYGRIVSCDRRKLNYEPIQAYPSAKLQRLIERYISPEEGS